jgi:hypothetical protein
MTHNRSTKSPSAAGLLPASEFQASQDGEWEWILSSCVCDDAETPTGYLECLPPVMAALWADTPSHSTSSTCAAAAPAAPSRFTVSAMAVITVGSELEWRNMPDGHNSVQGAGYSLSPAEMGCHTAGVIADVPNMPVIHTPHGAQEKEKHTWLREWGWGWGGGDGLTSNEVRGPRQQAKAL